MLAQSAYEHSELEEYIVSRDRAILPPLTCHIIRLNNGNCEIGIIQNRGQALNRIPGGTKDAIRPNGHDKWIILKCLLN
jgi:hypothetical protein